MVKKKKILKIVFSVTTIACVIMSMVTSAMALVLDNDVNKIGSLMKGTCTLTLVDTPDEVSSLTTDIDFTFGGRLPWMEPGGTNDKVASYEMWMPFDDNWNFLSKVNLARRNAPVTITTGGTVVYEFDSYRYNIINYINSSSEGEVSAYYNQAKFEFEPYYLPIPDSAIMEKLFQLRLNSTCTVTCSVTYSWLGLDNKVYTDTSVRYGNYAVGGSEVISGLLPGCINDIVEDVGSDPGSAGLFIEDMTVTVNPSVSTGSKANSIIFDMLCDVWNQATPQFYKENPTQEWLENIYKYIAPGSGGLPEFPDVEESVFMDFLVGSVGAFFDAELAPGFSLGGVFSVVLLVTLILVVLKYFAGG